MRVIQISDTHLSSRFGYFTANATALQAWLRTQSADLLVHTGDLAMDALGHRRDLEEARAWNRALPMAVHSVPGNHDVGESNSGDPHSQVTPSRLAQWQDVIGPDRWTIDRGGWRLIGLNAMLLGSGLAEEDDQLDWLAEAVASGGPVAIFLHKPLFLTDPEEGDRGYWTVPPAARRRFFSAIARRPVKLIASGHLHARRQDQRDGRSYVWGPSSSFIVADMKDDPGGEPRVGVVEHVFGPDSVESRFIDVPGMADLPIDPVLREIYPAIGAAD